MLSGGSIVSSLRLVRLYGFLFKFKKFGTLIHLFDDDRARSGKLTRPALFVKRVSAPCEGPVRQNNKTRQIRYRSAKYLLFKLLRNSEERITSRLAVRKGSVPFSLLPVQRCHDLSSYLAPVRHSPAPAA